MVSSSISRSLFVQASTAIVSSAANRELNILLILRFRRPLGRWMALSRLAGKIWASPNVA